MIFSSVEFCIEKRELLDFAIFSSLAKKEKKKFYLPEDAPEDFKNFINESRETVKVD